MVDLKITCALCGKQLDLTNTRALADGKGFICVDCFEKKSPQPRFSNGTDERSTLPPLSGLDSSTDAGISYTETRPETTSEIPNDGTFADKEYICDDCGYIFKRSPGTIVKACPYCGKTDDVHIKSSRPADDLID